MMNEKASEISNVGGLPLIHGRGGKSIIFGLGFGFTQNPHPSSVFQSGKKISPPKQEPLNVRVWPYLAAYFEG